MPRVPVFYSPSYAAAAHAFETTRKAAWAESLLSHPIPGVELRAPRSLTADEIALSGLHHARAGRGEGFCTFNGLALAARAALSAGARSVLVADLDAHGGGGTHEILAGDPRVTLLDVAVDRHDAYAPSPRSIVEAVDRADDYLPAVARAFARLPVGASFDLCLYNAGIDPHEDCPVGGLAGIGATMLAAREALVFDACRARRLPIAFVLAGGYLGNGLDRAALVALHRLTIEAAANG